MYVCTYIVFLTTALYFSLHEVTLQSLPLLPLIPGSGTGTRGKSKFSHLPVFVDPVVLAHWWGTAVRSAEGRTTPASRLSDSLLRAPGWTTAAWEADSPEWEAQNSVLHHLVPILVSLALRGRSRQWSILREEKKKIIQDEDIWIHGSSHKHNGFPLPPRKISTYPGTCVPRQCPGFPFRSTFPFSLYILCLNLSGGIARGVIVSALSYKSRFLQLSI